MINGCSNEQRTQHASRNNISIIHGASVRKIKTEFYKIYKHQYLEEYQKYLFDGICKTIFLYRKIYRCCERYRYHYHIYDKQDSANRSYGLYGRTEFVFAEHRCLNYRYKRIIFKIIGISRYSIQKYILEWVIFVIKKTLRNGVESNILVGIFRKFHYISKRYLKLYCVAY